MLVSVVVLSEVAGVAVAIVDSAGAVVVVVSVLPVVFGVILARTCCWLRGEYMAYSASLTSSPTCFTSYSQTLLHYVSGVGKGMVGFSGSSTTQLGNTLEESFPLPITFFYAHRNRLHETSSNETPIRITHFPSDEPTSRSR